MYYLCSLHVGVSLYFMCIPMYKFMSAAMASTRDEIFVELLYLVRVKPGGVDSRAIVHICARVSSYI